MDFVNLSLQYILMWYSDEKNCKLGKGAKVVGPMRLKNIESVIAHIIMLDILPLHHLLPFIRQQYYQHLESALFFFIYLTRLLKWAEERQI